MIKRCCVILQSANLLLGHRDRRIVCKVAPSLSAHLISLADMADRGARCRNSSHFSANTACAAMCACCSIFAYRSPLETPPQTIDGGHQCSVLGFNLLYVPFCDGPSSVWQYVA